VVVLDKWPTVRAEGSFALALMATNDVGARALVRWIKSDEGAVETVKKLLEGEQEKGVRENLTVVLVEIGKQCDDDEVLRARLDKIVERIYQSDT